MLLAGFLLSYFLQLASTQGQPRVSVISQPPSPHEFQNVTLSLQGAPVTIASCQWVRDTRLGRSGPILTFSPEGNPKLKNEEAYSGRETVHQNCSLHIQRVRVQDAGTYRVTLRTAHTHQQGDRDQQEEKTYEASVTLQVSKSNKIDLQVHQIPKVPRPGQDVTLVTHGIPERFYFCEWSKQTDFLVYKVIKTYAPEDRQQTSQQGREVIHRNCSLQISQLKTSDVGSYHIYVEAPLDQQDQQPGKGTGDRGGEGRQVYTGSVNLEVTEQSQTDTHHSGSSSLTYSAGVMAVVLLGSFAWTDPLLTVFSVFLFSLLSSGSSQETKNVPASLSKEHQVMFRE
uniref:Cell adhesion molecule CEACAM10-like isoform X1 n=1 Tax=Pogona vitticeps TaxID=103695 RepID=A0A6J0V7L3_9SAUR